MSVSSTHTVYLTFELPKGVWIGHTVGGDFYLRAESKESPEHALALAHEGSKKIAQAVFKEDLKVED